MNILIYRVVGAGLLMCILGGLILPVIHVTTPAFVDQVITLVTGAFLALISPRGTIAIGTGAETGTVGNAAQNP